ncbi:MAG: DNA recombination protein RmuC, partial [Bacteroidaceae bacterium]|nr:DNA recombination protein RmuC [Bacteroidaceae bacterium]
MQIVDIFGLILLFMMGWGIATWFSKKTRMRCLNELQQAKEQQEILQEQLTRMRQELGSAEQEKMRLVTLQKGERSQFDRELELQKNTYDQLLQLEKEKAKQEIATLKSFFESERNSFRETQKATKENFEQLRQQMEQQWKEKNELLKVEFQALSNDVLERKSSSLQQVNSEQIAAILNPLKDKMMHFEEAVKQNNISGAANKASIEKTIEEMMKRTQKIGEDAINLTKALKGNSKIQGDWGEMLLESILQHSGLRKDEEYVVQEDVKSANGKHYRPDVVVHFPDNRSVIIDSKVSLTAYVTYMSAVTEAERAVSLQEHLRSVKRHIDELAAKNYATLVENSIGYVLLFIPNEASYILAVQNDPSLSQYAYAKHIILLSPTNLMMALQLAY